MTPEQIETIFKIFKTNNPNPTTELEFHSNFELLIAVLLSAQATDIAVNKAIGPLFAIANTPEAILALGESTLISFIKSIGLYQTKAKHIMKLCEILIDEYHSEVPKTRDALESLPGVGRKTANVVLNTAFGEPTMAVDTHIFRVAQRIGLAKGKTPLDIELGLLKAIPKEYLKDAHHWLILHGRYICKAQKPQCSNCPIKNICEFNNKTF
jgi:endonuclease-3